MKSVASIGEEIQQIVDPTGKMQIEDMRIIGVWRTIISQSGYSARGLNSKIGYKYPFVMAESNIAKKENGLSIEFYSLSESLSEEILSGKLQSSNSQIISDFLGETNRFRKSDEAIGNSYPRETEDKIFRVFWAL